MSVYDAKQAAKREALAGTFGKLLWELEMAQAVDDKLLRDIVSDNRVPVTRQGSGASSGSKVTVPGAPVVRTGPTGAIADGTAAHAYGWANTPSIDNWRAPGQDLIDRALPAKGK